MEFCKVTLNLLSLWTKSYDVTIQMKDLCLYFHMMLFVCQNFRNLVEICLWPHLAVKGLRVWFFNLLWVGYRIREVVSKTKRMSFFEKLRGQWLEDLTLG